MTIGPPPKFHGTWDILDDLAAGTTSATTGRSSATRYSVSPPSHAVLGCPSQGPVRWDPAQRPASHPAMHQ
jgi:hypothetical protein